MDSSKNKKRKNLRLKYYDYSNPGAYFCTLCTQNGVALFGEITESKVVLNHVGEIIQETWNWLGGNYQFVQIDEFVIMPNHLHGIIVLGDHCSGGSRTATTKIVKPLGGIIGAFKTVSTKKINALRNTPGQKIWQRGYYEHVIRNREELERVREYISTNPIHWQFDRENPVFAARNELSAQFISPN